MKKIFLILDLALSMSFDVVAQRSDVFFKDYKLDYDNRLDDPNDLLNVPTGVLGNTNNESAPLGNGLLILTVIGTGYIIKKKHNKLV